MADGVKPTLLFFGNEQLATGIKSSAPTLQALIDDGYTIGAVIIAQNETGPSRTKHRLAVVEVAEQHDIPLLSPLSLKDPAVVQQLAAVSAEAAVLVAFGKIVPQAVLDVFPKGIINIHPSLLPRHRGSTPIESAILQGDKETGVSLMKLVPQMDAGPIYAQETVLLRGDEDKQVLTNQLLELGKDMLLSYLPHILDGSLEPAKQDEKQATTDGRINKKDAELQFTEKAASELARQVRAFAGWPRSRTMLGTTEAIITTAHAADIDGVPGSLWLGNQQLGIHAKEGTLIIDALIPAGRKEMSASAFLTGYRPEA